MRLIPDRLWAVMTVWQEARGESHDGRVAVGEVIRNRMARKYASDGTVAGTVLRPLQFSAWNTKDPNRIPAALLEYTDPVVLACAKAWDESWQSALTGGAVLYCVATMDPLPVWADPKKQTVQIGRHAFFVD